MLMNIECPKCRAINFHANSDIRYCALCGFEFKREEKKMSVSREIMKILKLQLRGALDVNKDITLYVSNSFYNWALIHDLEFKKAILKYNEVIGYLYDVPIKIDSVMEYEIRPNKNKKELIMLPEEVVKALNNFKKSKVSLNKLLGWVYKNTKTDRVQTIINYIDSNSNGLENIILAYKNGYTLPEAPYYIDEDEDFKVSFNSSVSRLLENPEYRNDAFFLKLRAGNYQAFSKEKAKIIADKLNELIQYYEDYLEEK